MAYQNQYISVGNQSQYIQRSFKGLRHCSNVQPRLSEVQGQKHKANHARKQVQLHGTGRTGRRLTTGAIPHHVGPGHISAIPAGRQCSSFCSISCAIRAAVPWRGEDIAENELRWRRGCSVTRSCAFDKHFTVTLLGCTGAIIVLGHHNICFISTSALPRIRPAHTNIIVKDNRGGQGNRRCHGRELCKLHLYTSS